MDHALFELREDRDEVAANDPVARQVVDRHRMDGTVLSGRVSAAHVDVG